MLLHAGYAKDTSDICKPHRTLQLHVVVGPQVPHDHRMRFTGLRRGLVFIHTMHTIDPCVEQFHAVALLLT